MRRGPDLSVERSCLSKSRFETKGAADHARKVAKDRGSWFDPAVRPYHCPHCGGWHLGRRRAALEPVPPPPPRRQAWDWRSALTAALAEEPEPC